MPFLAEHPESKIALEPADVGEKFRRRQELACPYCGEIVKYKKQGTNDAGERVSRAHFWHTENVGGNGSPGGCEKAGESPEHENWKMLIGELLKEEYGVDEFYVEHAIGGRTADVVVKSVAGHEGVAAEYQHRNKDKDYLGVTKEYVKNGYGVHWIFNTNSDYEMLFTAKEELERYMGRQPYLGEQNLSKISPDQLAKFGECVSIDKFNPQPTRLDECWALFFGELGIEYQYQTRSVETKTGTYLPDFYLPNVGVRSTEKGGMWVEVSTDVPDNWSGGVFDQMEEIVEVSGEPAAIVDGLPTNQRTAENQYEVNQSSNKDGDYMYVDWPMEWVKCDNCGSIKFEFRESNYMDCQSCAGRCSPDHDEIGLALEEVNRLNMRHAIRELAKG